MVKDVELKKDWNLVRDPTAATTGQVRPDVRENNARRQTGAELMRGQVARGDVPLPGQKSAVQLPHSQRLPQMLASKGAQPSPSPVSPHVEGGRTPSPQTPTATMGDAAAGAQYAENMDAAKLAARGLNTLRQGGQAAKLAASPESKTPLTPEVAMRNALIASLVPGTKPTAQPKLPATPAKIATPDARTTQEPAIENAALAKAHAGEMGAKRGKDEEIVAAHVAQGAPSPFANRPRGDKVADHEAERKKIATNRESAGALAGVASGIRRVVAWAGGSEEFSGGSHQGGFTDEIRIFSELVDANGTVSGSLVYGDTRDYPETELRNTKLGLSNVLYGEQELLQRAIPIDERIANSWDNTAFSRRVMTADPKDIAKMAIDSRRGGIWG